MKLASDKKELLNHIIEDLKRIDEVKAIVLGGSYAMGMATESSDLDIGIYYEEQHPFDVKEIKSIAEKYAVDEQPTVTEFYEWGPWVNGGAWIKTKIAKVDFLYRNINQIISTIENARKGIWENHFEQQPPYGFSSIFYLAEIRYCIAIHDPENIIRQLKQRVKKYPQKLKQSVIQQSLWSAEFTIWQAESFAGKNDVYNAVGCLTRAVKNIITALFAINQIYPIGDKRAIGILEKSKIKPFGLSKKINIILCADKNNLPRNVLQLKELFSQTVKLTEGFYKSSFRL